MCADFEGLDSFEASRARSWHFSVWGAGEENGSLFVRTKHQMLFLDGSLVSSIMLAHLLI